MEANEVAPKRRELSLLALLALSLGPALLLLLAPEVLRPMHGLGRTLVLSTYFLIDAIVLLAIMIIYARATGVTFREATGYTRRLPIWLFLALAAIGAIWSIAFRDFIPLPALRDFSSWLMTQAPWWPSLFGRMPENQGFFADAGAGATLALTLFAAVAIVAASLAQSLYFQGFLLSRMERFGWLAPLLNNAFFIAYHLGSPFFWPQFFIFTIVWAVIAYATKNVWNQAVAHGIMNGYQYVPALWTQIRAFGG